MTTYRLFAGSKTTLEPIMNCLPPVIQEELIADHIKNGGPDRKLAFHPVSRAVAGFGHSLTVTLNTEDFILFSLASADLVAAKELFIYYEDTHEPISGKGAGFQEIKVEISFTAFEDAEDELAKAT